MNGIPDDIDLSFLVGGQLIQVCVGEWDLRVDFSPSASISIEGGFAIVPATDVPGESTRLASIVGVVKLLGLKITDVRIEGHDTLILVFGDAGEVIIRDDNPHYECFVISAPGQTIVV